MEFVASCRRINYHGPLRELWVEATQGANVLHLADFCPREHGQLLLFSLFVKEHFRTVRAAFNAMVPAGSTSMTQPEFSQALTDHGFVGDGALRSMPWFLRDPLR